MKAMLLAITVIVVVIAAFAYVVYTDPNRAQTRAAFAVLHGESSGIPKEPSAPGYLNLHDKDAETLNREFSEELAIKETPSLIVQGTLLRQDYLLRQAEYKLAQIRSVGGDTPSKELEEKRTAYAEATKRFQIFLDEKNQGSDP